MMVKKMLARALGVVVAVYSLSGIAADRVEVGPGPLWERGVIDQIDYKGGIMVVNDASYQIAPDVVVFRGRAKSIGIERLKVGMSIEYRLSTNLASDSPLIFQIKMR